MTTQTEPSKKTSLVDRLLAKKGPAVLTDVERVELHAAFSDIAHSNLRLTRMVDSVAEALRWNSLKVVHATRDDGSVGYDLRNAPNTEDASIESSSQASAGT